MKVELVFGVVLGPGYLLKPVGFCVDELCILWNWLVWIPEEENRRDENQRDVFKVPNCVYVPIYSL